VALQSNPENRATAYKLKYIIDKSLIPQMEARMRKNQNNSFFQGGSNNGSGECSGLRYIPTSCVRNVERQRKQKEVK
jgi:hypothetical protein